MVSTKKSIPVKMNEAPYPLPRLPSMEGMECSVGPVSDVMSNINTDASMLLDVFSYTSEQQYSKENHASQLKEVSSSFNVDSIDSPDERIHASITPSLTSTISRKNTEKSNISDQAHQDHYYDSDHPNATDGNVTNNEWKKLSVSSHDKFIFMDCTQKCTKQNGKICTPSGIGDAEDFIGDVNDVDDTSIIKETYQPPPIESEVPVSYTKIKRLYENGTIVD